MKFPSYRQYDRMDCGPACLKIIAKYYGKIFSLKYLRDHCYLTHEGVSLFDICHAAEDIGFRTLSLKVSLAAADLQSVASCQSKKHHNSQFRCLTNHCLLHNL